MILLTVVSAPRTFTSDAEVVLWVSVIVASMICAVIVAMTCRE